MHRNFVNTRRSLIGRLIDGHICDILRHAVQGGKWAFVASDTSLPGCGGYSFKNVAPDHAKDFYDYFFAEGRKGGMVAFEPDFLQQNYQCLPAFNTNLSAMPTWLAGLNAAGMAVEPPVPIQFCMATPMELLASIALPTVTNFRASNDFFYGGSYKLGSSSLLIWAAVCFLLKNLHFLLKNLHFLLKNVDFLLKNVDFII